ncbi:hypothetical protein TorRG33x02_093740, partial [Trema orientale]
QIHIGTWGKPSLASEQNIAIQKMLMAVAKVASTIALRAEIIGVTPVVEARHASEIQRVELYATPVTPNCPSFDDVIESEDFPEVEAAVAIGIELREHVRVDPVIAILLEEPGELRVTDSLITVCVHGSEKVGGQMLVVS